MSSKNKIIIIGSFLIVLLILSIICFCMPSIKIKINGEKNIILSIGEEYKDQGAKAYLIKNLTKEKISNTAEGKVDTSKVGKYIITYKANYKRITTEAIRIVNVVDNIKPEIILNKKVNVCKNNNLIEVDANAYDNYDGDITENIKYKLNKEKVYITVEDSSKNQAKLIENVNFIDAEKPTITLIGSEIIYLTLNEAYQELGATAYDSCDGDITSNIEIQNNINANIAGTYQVVYRIKDSMHNVTEKIRTIVVQSIEKAEDNRYPIINGATIYLTFDDGPNQYTEHILEVLDKYNIKATFFVTNQFPEYQHIIKKEYENGHTVGIHTYSHKWSIYESVESYLNDFNKIDEIIFNETGIHPKIFRFPGGSSNKVSQNYKKGIITELAKLMTDKGYIYFDWTIDSGDTNKKNNSPEDIIKNVKSHLKGDGEYIILMHDIKKNTLDALPTIIEYAKAEGYEFAPLTENSPIKHFKIAN